jgi:hypothetical protein
MASIEIEIEDYLTHEEVKDVVKSEVRSYVRFLMATENQSSPNANWFFAKKLAKELALEGVQQFIPNFKELLNEHIQEQIKSIELYDIFAQNIGWKSDGNKIVNEVLKNNKDLLDAKLKEMLKPRD